MTVLRADGIGKSYGGVRALDQCTVGVAAGTITGLIGPNGSGKTTLFNVITGYARPDAGEVYLNGRRITGAPPERVFGAGVGRTFQLTRVFATLTVWENTQVPARVRPGKAAEALELVGLASHRDTPAGQLSYGQRKLLELACVLAAGPEIILLDEPAGGVNPTLVAQLAGHITALNAAGTTFLIVEHNMEFVMGLCHQVTVLDAGTVVASGPPDIIRTDPRVLDAYLGADVEA